MTDTSGTQGQESGNQQGGTTGQESGAGAGQGQESGQQGQNQQQGTGQQGQGQASQFDLSTIQDPALRSYLETIQKDLSETRQEAARYRTERNTLQQAQETEAERIQREAAERDERLRTLEEENRALKVNGLVETAAKEAKAHNPATVVRMLASQVELGEDGKPKNLTDLLTALRQSDPYLFKRQNNNAGDGQGDDDTGTSDMNSLIRGQVAARRGGR